MRIALRKVLSYTLALGALTAAPGSAHAQTPAPSAPEDPKRTEEARSRFQRGVELYKDGDYRAAIIEFRRAYDLVPNWRIQYNLAQACAEVQDYPCALRALQAYVTDGGAEIPADRRAQVDTELKRLSGRIARVTVKVNRSDAEVFADETSVGKTPLQAASLVSAGRRRISATLPSGQTIAKIVEVAGGDEITVSLDFEDAPRTRTEVPQPRLTTEAPSSAPVYIGLVATGLLAAGTATTGLLALSADRDLTTELDRIPGDGAAIDDARGRTETLGMVTNVLGAAAIVAGGVTLYLALTRPSSTPKVGVTTLPGGALLSGRF